MADGVYQSRSDETGGEQLAAMAFVEAKSGMRVDCLMLIDGCAMIVGHYLTGRYSGKRALVASSFNPEMTLRRWKQRYDEKANASVWLDATRLPRGCL